KKLEDERAAKKKFPERPERDVLLFLLENAPMERWEADILSLMREEAYYFAPQGQTKIINEGWACIIRNSPVFSSLGIVTIEDIVAADKVKVSDGRSARSVYDRNVICNQSTITVRSRRGLKITGSRNHRLLLPDGETWRRLDELAVGDHVAISGGAGLWAKDEVGIAWLPDEPIRWIGDFDTAVELFGLLTRATLVENRWRVIIHSETLSDLLVEELGFTTGPSAREKQVPKAILRSPKHVVAAFLRAYFDCDGYAGKAGVILSTSSEVMSEQVQLLLLNFGILSRRRLQKDECWHVQ